MEVTTMMMSMSMRISSIMHRLGECMFPVGDLGH